MACQAPCASATPQAPFLEGARPPEIYPTATADRRSLAVLIRTLLKLLGNDLGSLIEVGAEYRGDDEAGAPVGGLSDLLLARSEKMTLGIDAICDECA